MKRNGNFRQIYWGYFSLIELEQTRNETNILGDKIMGYSDNTYQIGQMLHKEYEATYSSHVGSENGASIAPAKSIKLMSTLGTLFVAGFFITQLVIF